MKNSHSILEDEITYFESKYQMDLPLLQKFVFDKVNEYSINSLFFRSKEFDIAEDILISGCSFTYGIGVPEEEIWGVKVANTLNMGYHNISGPGKSVSWIINNIFQYIKIYGKPKTIICLFPEFTRMEIRSRMDFMIPNAWPKESSIEVGSYSVQLEDSYAKKNKFSKIPHIAERVMPPELAVKISIQYIKMLEMYCESEGIKFVWSTWFDKQLDYLVNNILNTDFNNFISLDLNSWDEMNYKENNQVVNCHSEFKEKYGENFYIGMDKYVTKGAPHWGVHKHMHISESFLKELTWQ